MNSDSGRLFEMAAVSTKPAATGKTADFELALGEKIVRVIPDVSGIGKQFDYVAPASWADRIQVGSLVRFDLHGRRVAGWVTAFGEAGVVGARPLKKLLKFSSVGPPAEIVELAEWAAARWSGSISKVLRSASAQNMVAKWPVTNGADIGENQKDRQIDHPAKLEPKVPEALVARVSAAGSEPATVMVETSPVDTGVELVAYLAQTHLSMVNQGASVLVLVPTIAQAKQLRRLLQQKLDTAGIKIHQQFDSWAAGYIGGVVIGCRSTVWAPCVDLRSIIVIDEQNESYQDERTPNWNARDVAIERAKRLEIDCILTSPTPSLAATAVANETIKMSRTAQRAGWPAVRVIDMREIEPSLRGLFPPELVQELREAENVLAILNRKGRAVMLACYTCNELVKTEDGQHLMKEVDGQLISELNDESRPLVCLSCSGTKLKRLRLGVNKAAEEMSRLLKRPVTEMSSESDRLASSSQAAIVLGTEAAIYQSLANRNRPDVIAFLDFDQELLASRYKAAEQAHALLGLAARVVGGRRPESKIVIQTHVPDHRAIVAAVRAEPELFSQPELELRHSAQLPPAVAMCELSGAGAAELVAALEAESVEGDELAIMGPRSERYLVRAKTSIALADLLARTKRPKKRVRIRVDPQRV